MKKILFVCTGNICRSPTAEAIFRHKVQERGLAGRLGWDSAGTHDYHIGAAPDRRSVQVAGNRGVRMDDLRARQVTRQDFEDFDLVLAMDRGHYRTLEKLAAPQGLDRLMLFLDCHERHAGQDVPDPYYGDMSGFEKIYDLIEEGVEALMRKIADELV